jgi:hypothetical protein
MGQRKIGLLCGRGRQMTRYYVTGWSARYGNWHAEIFECMSMEYAKKRFLASYPTLKQIKVYPLREN